MTRSAEHTSASVAEQVRDFYDHYPYPPPIENLEEYQLRWQDHERRRADYHLYWPGRAYREDQTILVAGCGTSQADKHAVRWPEAHVTAIDCSVTSVHYTQQLKEKYELKNLEVHQLPLERASDLGMSFDQVVCTGVLHHLADPDAGLAALCSVLKPDGVMQLMVYAPYGRVGIYMLQEFCRRVGIQPTDSEVQDLIGALYELPKGHPLQGLLAHAPDFRNEAALTDALLHPQDRPYSVPELFAFIEKAGLKFGRWVRQAPYSVQCGALKRIPQAAKLASLPLVEQFAAIELFRGTMVRHSVIVYRADSANRVHSVSFSDDEWINYVPIRMPDTICVQDRVPDGFAAVLINRTHTHKDLFLPISPAEKKLFDAIDGQSTIGNIGERSLGGANPAKPDSLARTFFEQLWWHDQVVFDTGLTH